MACKARGGDFVEAGTSRRPRNDSTLAGAARERRMNLHGVNRVSVSRGHQGDSRIGGCAAQTALGLTASMI